MSHKQTNTHYSIVAAISCDGKITKGNSLGSNWTSKEDKKFLHKELDEADVILIGRKTYEIAEKYLAERNCLVFTRKIKFPEVMSDKVTFFNLESGDIKKYLKERNYKKAVILGGTEIYSYFLEKNLTDEICLTIEPLIFGEGLSLASLKVPFKNKLELKSVKKLNRVGTLLVRYKIK